MSETNEVCRFSPRVFFLNRIDVVSGIFRFYNRRFDDFHLDKLSMRRFLVHFVVSSRRVWPLITHLRMLDKRLMTNSGPSLIKKKNKKLKSVGNLEWIEVFVHFPVNYSEESQISV